MRIQAFIGHPSKKTFPCLRGLWRGFPVIIEVYQGFEQG